MENFAKYVQIMRGILFMLLVVSALFGIKHHIHSKKIDRKVSGSSNLIIP